MVEATLPKGAQDYMPLGILLGVSECRRGLLEAAGVQSSWGCDKLNLITGPTAP